MTEQQIQSKIIKYLESNGCFVLKLIRTNKNGIPDLSIFKNGKAFFIEVKKKDGVLSEMQKYRIKEIETFGFKTLVFYEFNKLDLEEYLK